MKLNTDYEILKQDYECFKPYFELHRQSIEKLFYHYLNQGNSKDLNEFFEKNLDKEITNEFKQKFIYNSTVCFYRSFDLFLALVTLESRKFNTWSEVTAYYSKFYIIKAICFLFQRGHMVLNSLGSRPLNDKNDKKFFFYFDTKLQLFNHKTPEYKELFKNGKGSHQVWWSLLNSLKGIVGIKNERFNFVLDQYLTNPSIRNEVNYSLEYLEGFHELEWFDSNIQDRFNRMNYTDSNKLRDFTSKERFYQNTHPEQIDEGDYYTDIRVFIWESLLCYLEIFKDLLGDNFLLKRENIEYLLEAHQFKEISTSLEDSMKTELKRILG
ncbi:hypothetical protein [Bacillus sp. AFS041924]|uniref:hypothetical protein n=1 Tax=Bacillus sp. AFS041924 TaxID=2033503 RepID=UPI000BFC7784|nr:hypothetical protein [Bacillus sp. AFS041924]PGS49897.1 hypothetical protein COC46_14200 [Bacillus sp. AFS041924]